MWLTDVDAARANPENTSASPRAVDPVQASSGDVLLGRHAPTTRPGGQTQPATADANVHISAGSNSTAFASAVVDAVLAADLSVPPDDGSDHVSTAFHFTSGPDSFWFNDDGTADGSLKPVGADSAAGVAVLDANFATSPWHSSSELFVNANADGLFHDSSVGNYASINNGGYSASHAGTDSNVGQVPIAAAGPIGVTSTAPVAIAIAGPLTEGSNFQPPPSADVPVHAALAGSLTTNSFPTGNAVGSTSTIPDVDHHWDGITSAQDQLYSGNYYPPDNGFAAGAHVAISAVNDIIQFTTLTGSGALTESLETFFAPVDASALRSGYFLTDPRVLYDTATHQFIVAVDEVGNPSNPYAGNPDSSFVLIAVSKTDLSAPSLSSSNWQFESLSATYNIGGTTTWADQPLVSVDGHNIYVSTNQFNVSGSYNTDSFIANVVSVYNDGLYSAGGVSKVVSATAYSDSSYQPVAIAGGGELLVSYTYNGLSIFESMPTSTGVTLSAPLNVSLGTIDFGNSDYAASQLGTSHTLDAMDGRITGAAYNSAHQMLYVVFEVQPSQSSATPAEEWVQLDMHNFNASGGTQAPIVLHMGNLNSLLPTTGATAGAATFNGSVAVDGNGDVLFNFNVSGPNMYPADYFTYWQGAGSATASTVPNLAVPIDYHDSVAAYIDPANDAMGRWGDYSTAVADPNASNAFYISNEFANGSSTWGTSVAHVVLPFAPTSPPLVTIQLAKDTGWSSAGGVTSNDTLTGTGDPNATVTITSGAATLGTTTANASGGWSFTPTGLADGSYTVTASETNSIGPGSASLSFTLDTSIPIVTSDTVSGAGIGGGAGVLSASELAVFALALNEAVQVSGGTPSLTLNDGGSAVYDAAKSTPTSLVFDYTVGSNQYTNSLAVTGVTLNGATVTEIAGNAANLSGAVTSFPNLVVDGTTPVAHVDHGHDLLNASLSALASHGVLANDSDADPSDVLTVSAVNGSSANVGQSVTGTYGVLKLNADGSYTYTNTNASAVTALGGVTDDTISYTISNGHGGTASSVLNVLITSPGQTYVTGASGSSISGGSGSYVLDGSAGKMTLTAGVSGKQWLVGGPGDTLNASFSAADNFLFAPNFGKETINHFNTKIDVIDLPHSLFPDFAAVQADMHTVGLSTVITLDATDSITLSYVSALSLHSQNFHLF